MVPHVRHTDLMVVVVVAGICVWGVSSTLIIRALQKPPSSVLKHVSTPFNLGLTFAGLHALDPAVVQFIIAGTSTILIPSTARSTTTGSPGFLERATIWTHLICRDDHFRFERRDRWRGRCFPSC